jgi:ABC-type Fe3+-siderophore transport system permease subunit
MQTALIIMLKFAMGSSAENFGIDLAMWLPVGAWIGASIVAVIVLRLSRQHSALIR